MALPAGVTTSTLTFGPYTDAEGDVQFEGMTGLITPSATVRHIATGAVIVQQPIKVVIGQGGVGSVVLPNTDLATCTPTGFTYTLTWQVGRFDSSPGNATFALPSTAGATVDFDTLTPSQSTPGIVVPTNVGPVGPQGPAGPAGPTGAASTVPGPQGPAGPIGPAGSSATVTDAAMAAAYGPQTGAAVAADPLLKAAFVPRWQANTAYAAGDPVLNPSGQIVTANAAFTSGATYSASNWTVVSSGGGSGAGLPSTVVSKTTAYTAAAGDFVQGDTSSAGFTVTLPTAPAIGALVAVKKVDSTTNTLTIVPAAGGSIDGDPNATTTTKMAGAIFEHVGANVWRIVASMTTTGPQGPAGATGATGPAGATGATGAAGSNGAISQLQDEGANLTVRPTINFVGAGVTATDDATNSRTVVTIPGGGGGGAAVGSWQTPIVISGRYTANGTGGATGQGYTAGRMYYVPYRPGVSFTVTEMGIEVTTGVASATARIGIYADSGGQPGALLVEATAATQLDCSTTGYKASPAISQALIAGTQYWLGYVAQGANPTVRLCSSVALDLTFNFISTTSATNFGFNAYEYYQNTVTGALPSTAAVAGTINEVLPKISLKAA